MSAQLLNMRVLILGERRNELGAWEIHILSGSRWEGVIEVEGHLYNAIDAGNELAKSMNARFAPYGRVAQ